ncbi:hypothetical protein D1N53_24540, partial [Clostridioides difficile]
GTASLSNNLESKLKNPTRLSGSSRDETNSKIIDNFYKKDTLKMLTYKIEELEVKANKLFEKITALNLNANINIEDGFSQVG